MITTREAKPQTVKVRGFVDRRVVEVEVPGPLAVSGKGST
jgi:hypothetical protein